MKEQIYRGYEIGVKQNNVVYYDSQYTGYIKSKISGSIYFDGSSYDKPETALREIKVILDEYLDGTPDTKNVFKTFRFGM